MNEQTEIVERYLEGSLSGVELAEFEEQLRSDSLLRERVEELKLIEEGIKQASRKQALVDLQNVEATLPAIETPLVPLWRNGWLQAAAVITMLAVCSYLLLPGEVATQQLFAEYFQPYPNIIMPTVRGAVENDSTVKALAFKAYDQQNYEEAIRLFESLEQQDEGALLYLGNSYLALGEPKKAIPYFEKVLADFDVFDEQAEWYLAVSYLKLEEREKAKVVLQKVVASGSAYTQKAQWILEKLN